ncbi:hypothetical protein QCA50_014388 [Cerrena zonata]|uniref:Phosphatidylserine decarboxylase proenzyme 2 n=1 Tax=Cerrena zonata TaxID=2478898 RepID=A0AAW0FNM6_9APHY
MKKSFGKPKALKIKSAIKSAARLPAKVTGGSSSRNNFSPLAGENPIVVLKVQVLSCKDLFAKDRNGYSDPFVVVSVLGTRHSTPVIKRTLNPIYAAKDATFEFPIYLSTADKLGVIEAVIWDKDVLGKEYLGEVSIPLEDWFRDDNALDFNDSNNKPLNLNVVSTRIGAQATGTAQVKLGFVHPPNISSLMEFSEVYSQLVKISRPSVVSAPPTEGIGTIRSHEGGPRFEDDGLSSDDGESETEDEEDDIVQPVPVPATESSTTPLASPLTPTPASQVKTPTGPKPPSPFSIPKLFPRKASSTRSSSIDSTMAAVNNIPSAPPSPLPQSVSTPVTAAPEKRKRMRRRRKGGDDGYHFNTENDILGIVMLEVRGAKDLPKIRNLTRIGWDMDPFVVISFGKKVFRTRVIRHSLDPTWDEKLLFHVRRYETSFKVNFSILDWDKLSGNDHVGDVSFDVAELLANAPQKDPVTGLYPEINDDDHNGMKDFTLPLATNNSPWETKHSPQISFRAKYQPYDALRQRFWRQVLKEYDTDDNRFLSRLELTTMLDSLNSTLSHSTIDTFFTRRNKHPQTDSLTFEEAIMCLEEELIKPNSEKKRINFDDMSADSSVPLTPAIPVSNADRPFGLNLDKLDFSGPPHNQPSPESDPLQKTSQPQPYTTEPSQQLLTDAAAPIQPARLGQIDRQASAASSDIEESSSGSSSPAHENFERVINIKNCPLCHRPRLSSKAEVDIVTHLAVCASQDWARMDRMLVDSYVTASQAQRKWYTKVLHKVSAGDYKLGANSANIIVQNRITGKLEEEKMQSYVRLGIRLLYKGWKSSIESSRAKKLLKSMSIKQGIKYDSPESARDIPAFIDFHNLDVTEIRDPLDSFKTFNEFFYRKLKVDARPVEQPENPYRLVSGADCRLMAFQTIDDATKLWIKGREFSLARLFGDAYKSEASRYNGGALCIFRLAPQDYHRFHCPVDGKIGPMTFVPGEYYTVNPQAIRTALDVYGENARKIVPIDSPQFGRVMCVCVGAMMVGSIKTTVSEGQEVKRGDEFGYFAFGGSTIVVVFEPNVVEWDEDLVINGKACLETLVRVGMGLGRSLRAPAKTRIQASTNVKGDKNKLSMLSVILQILKEEGIPGLYKGFGATMLNTFSMRTFTIPTKYTSGFNLPRTEYAYFFFYSFVRTSYIKRLTSKLPKGSKVPALSTAAELLLGAVAGALAQIFTIPVSVIATRQQIGPSSRSRKATPPKDIEKDDKVDRSSTSTPLEVPYDDSFLGVAKEIVEEEGVTDLWLGIKPGLVLTVNPAITYGMYERVKNVMLLAKQSASTAVGDNEKLSPWMTFFIGAMSKTLATVVTYPYIMAKVRIQARSADEEDAIEEHHPKPKPHGYHHDKYKHVGALDILARVWRKEGPVGWYQGMNAQITKAVISQALLFLSKEQFEQWALAIMVLLYRLQRAPSV